MSSNQPTVAPQEPRAWLFHQVNRLYTTLIPHKVRDFFALLLFRISPDVPESLSSACNNANLSAVFVIAYSLTFIMCFLVVIIWCAMNGTLRGGDPSRLYFLKDWVNLLNYTLLCPLYVGFGAVLITTTVKGWADLSNMTHTEETHARPFRQYGAAFLLLLLIVMVALFGNARFMAENMNPAIYPLNYWFIDHTNLDGSRVIGALGFYYGLLNFCLLFFTLLVTAAFVSEFRLLFQVAESLDRLCLKQPVSTELLRNRLNSFTQAYLAGKLAVASYMANALVWKTSQAQHSTNLLFLGAALTLFGVVFLSIPRYYIELQWFRLRAASAADATTIGYEDLRPWEINFVGGSWKPRVMANVIDTLIIGGFVTSFWR
ncbi:MAG: hypothetical protein ABSF70_14590 [Terracidiphilus sp.]